MIKQVLFIAGLATVLPVHMAAAQQRQLGTHQHGHGTLNVVLDGNRVSMELDVPGADIVGFEHAAKTKAQRAAIDAAKSQLGSPQSLFIFPAGAGCSLKSTAVKMEGAEEASGKSEERHADFNAEYQFECAAAASVTSIELPYFKTFPRTEALTVNVVTPKGQTSIEVNRRRPVLSLAGII